IQSSIAKQWGSAPTSSSASFIDNTSRRKFDLEKLIEDTKRLAPIYPSLPHKLVSKVSSFALKKVYEQFLKALRVTFDNPFEPYMDNIHHHWWIKDHQLPQARDVENPLLQLLNKLTHKYDSWHVPQQMAARDKLAQNSTKRDPSAFELEEIRINSRRCGMCKRTEHNSRMCPNNVKHSVTEI
ncbi:26500_t:CDS:2, partial [Gigaspora margarita]